MLFLHSMSGVLQRKSIMDKKVCLMNQTEAKLNTIYKSPTKILLPMFRKLNLKQKFLGFFCVCFDFISFYILFEQKVSVLGGKHILSVNIFLPSPCFPIRKS